MPRDMLWGLLVGYEVDVAYDDMYTLHVKRIAFKDLEWVISI
jgi:hypothetical protein